ncbi:MAG: beta-galactosidase [Bryobacteraceae bacterium]|nr:beta-galactosidase [Bryobacteraceae bacterium]
MKHAAVLLLLTAALNAADLPPGVLYGAAYYHEYMPTDRLDEDTRLMKRANLTVVRVGESTWSSWEPRDGQFEFAWMDRVVDAMHKAGIRVIMGTPTYSIPAWLYKKYPDILVSHMTEAPPLSDPYMPSYRGSAPGGAYGPRQNIDFTHPEYLRHAERVILKIVDRYKDHPGIIGWQIDNETGPIPAILERHHPAFTEWLRERYGTVDRINRLWGLVYWGQLVSSWEDLPPRAGILNPGYRLAWEQFQREQVTRFLAWQAKLLRDRIPKDDFITHDFVGGLRTNLDQWAISQHLDVVATNPYHPTQDRFDGYDLAFTGDVARSLKQLPYLVTETNAQTIGWDSRAQYPPFDGQLRLAAWANAASGARMIAYWHWHSLHYGQETYWKGLLGHDLQPNRVYEEAARTGAELVKHSPRAALARKENRAAILVSLSSYDAIRAMPFADRHDYSSVLRQMHRALYDLNIEADLVPAGARDLSRYRLLLVPPLYAAADSVLDAVARFVEQGGHAIVAFKSGFADEESTVRTDLQPARLRMAAGIFYREFTSLPRPLALTPDRYGLGEANAAQSWAEMAVPEGAEKLLGYTGDFLSPYAAVTRNRHGKGSLTYQAALLSNDLQRAVIAEVAGMAGVRGPEKSLPAAIRMRQGLNAQGERVVYLMNFSPLPAEFVWQWDGGEEILSGRRLANGARLSIGKWGLAIVVSPPR